jgi:hypothetical protein
VFQHFSLIERGWIDRRDRSGMIFRSNSTMPLINLEKENKNVKSGFLLDQLLFQLIELKFLKIA